MNTSQRRGKERFDSLEGNKKKDESTDESEVAEDLTKEVSHSANRSVTERLKAESILVK